MNYLKSKTLNFNVFVPALAGVAVAFGITIPPEVIAGVLAIGNFLLRFVTKVPLAEK
jgi:hypothetical protein